MSKLLDFILCSTTVLTELIAVFILAIIVQAVFYRVFNINLYKIIRNKLEELERRIERWNYSF